MRGIARAAGAIITAAVITVGSALPVLAQSSTTNPALTAHFCPLPNGEGVSSTCRLAGDGSIRVLYGYAKTITPALADAMISVTWDTMRKYHDIGLEHAAMGSDDVIQVVIEAGDGDPLYSWKTANLYIGEGSATKIGSATAGAGNAAATLELRHELVHLIQGRAYYMAAGRLGDATTWWLETTAESLPFLIDSHGAAHNAELYGSATLDDMRTNVSQEAPLQWPSDSFYQHAQRLYASTCPGCALTQGQIIKALNEGIYPLEDTAARKRFADGLDDYAKYLLTGKHPVHGTVAPIAAGTAVGDYIGLIEGESGAGLGVGMKTNSFPPQIAPKAGTVTAPLDSDSLYVLSIASGAAAQPWLRQARTYPPGMPVMFHVAPGVETWYRIDGGPVQHHTGGGELVLGPIHADLGLGNVRLVGVAKDAATTFEGTFYPADLSGDWVITPKGKGKVISKQCPKATLSTGTDMIDYISRVGAGHGAYQSGADGHYQWVKDSPIRSPITGGKKDKSSLVTYSASMKLDDKLIGKIDYDGPSIPKGSAGFELDVRGEMTFDSLVSKAVVSGAQPNTKAKSSKKATTAAKKAPIWVATGIAVIEVETLHVHLDNTPRTKNKRVWHRDRCIVKTEVPVTGELYRDGVIKEPKIN